MSSYVALILFGTAFLTYGIRVLPFLSPALQSLPVFLKRILTIMPVAALGALIFPASIQAVPDMPLAGLVGICAAALAAVVVKGNLIVPVVVSIGATWLVLSI
jgi:branched-subunit amino acid transport protein